MAVFVLSGSKPVKCFSVPQSLPGKYTLVKTYYMRLADRFNDGKSRALDVILSALEVFSL